jgi:hypothetical protein
VKKYLAIGLVFALAGCATVKTWQATGGSRSDGTVRLSYEYGMFEQPQLDEGQALALARQRCAVWGYSGAEAFGGVTQVCNAMTNSGCASYLVTKEFQCLGTGTPGASASILVRTPYRGAH